jgi:hypothetical protein
VEATYAVEDSPLIKRLRESGVPQLVDPQTLRFTGERFLAVAQFERVPYRPATRITAGSFTPSDADALARNVMLFEQEIGASWYAQINHNLMVPINATCAHQCQSMPPAPSNAINATALPWRSRPQNSQLQRGWSGTKTARDWAQFGHKRLPATRTTSCARRSATPCF